VWVYAGLFGAGFAATAAIVPLTLTASTRTAAAVPLGDYAGYADPSGVRQFGSDTATNPTLASDYLDGTGWSQMVSSADGLNAWKGYRLVLGVPIIPSSSGASLAQGASGAYNQYFASLAQNLVNAGQANAILRLGWEFNGNWMAWSVANSTDAANFVAYWQQIVTTMRAVAGQQFAFLWNPNGAPGTTSYTPDQAYPGDAYVDYVGTDLYDECWCSPQTPQNAWSGDLSAEWGLNWLAGFAAQHGKSMAFPEWSVTIRNDGHGLGDDPYFINQFAGWVAANNVAFTNIFSYNDTSGGQDNDITDGNFPNALAAFKQDFGGAAASVPSGTPAPAPAPAPVPVPKPAPAPAPKPAPAPVIAPKPAPKPAPEPAPVHIPIPGTVLPSLANAHSATAATGGAASAHGALGAPPSTPAGGASAPATLGTASTHSPGHVPSNGSDPLSRAGTTARGAATAGSVTDMSANGTAGGHSPDLVAVVGMFMLGGLLGLGLALRRRPGGRAILAAHHSA